MRYNRFFTLKDLWKSWTDWGTPFIFPRILGIWKIAGVIIIIIPKFPLLKEWAYAGFFFVMTGAIFSHMAISDSIVELFPANILLLMTILSGYFRPANRKLNA